MNRIKNVIAVCAACAGVTTVVSASAVPMPAQTAEEVIALAHRTAEYVGRSAPAEELKPLLDELAIDEAWYAKGKANHNAADMRNAEREIRSVRRRILFKHPDLQFKRLLAVQRGLPFSQEAGTADQNAGRWSSPGPGLIALDNWQTAPHKTILLDGKLPKGCTLNPDLHWDADRIVFAFNDHTRKPEADPKAMGAPPVVSPDNKCCIWISSVDSGNPSFDTPDAPYGAMHHRYFIYECSADGSWVRQLTGIPSDPMRTWENRQTLILEDADPCYLPDGGIVFHSTRSQTFARCHAGRYVPAWLLHRMNGDGSGIRQLSWGEANEWEPTVLKDGTICYTRWDYINRHAMWFSSLWTTRPDGTAVAHYYGNYSKTIFTTTEPKAIPGSSKIVATASAHHMFNAGSLMIIDTAKGEDGEAPLTRLTPDTPFPEACNDNGPDKFKVTGLYKDAMPVNDTIFFASYSPDTLWFPEGHPRQHSHEWTGAWPHPRSFGVWIVDTLGGRELIYQDNEWSTFNPIPLVKRSKPPALASVLPLAEKTPMQGLCYVENVYDSRVDLPKGSVKALRINKLYNQGAAQHFSWNKGADLDIYKESLGTVPVAADGSAAFSIPAETPIQLQALDKDGMAILTMRSFIYAQKGEIQGCVGCHEQKNRSGTKSFSTLKLKETPQVPVPEIDLGYTGPFSYVRSVQPIFDRKCISCHGLGKAPDFIGTNGCRRLVKDKQVCFAPSYQETIESKPYDYFAAPSPLTKRLQKGHGGVKLTPEEWKTLILWMDYNVPEHNPGGGYNWDRPELRETEPAGEAALRAAIAAAELPGQDAAAVAKQPFEALVNRGDEAKSRILWLVKPEDRVRFLALVKKTLVQHKYPDLNGTCGRPVGEPCLCNSCWVLRGRFNVPGLRDPVTGAPPPASYRAPAVQTADADEFTPIFNGRDLTGWIGNTNVYWVSEPGILQCGGHDGVTPTPDDAIMTEKEYADFTIRFDFRTWKGGDNGFGFRYPGVDDMAYSGIEMQLADTVRGGKGPDAWRAFGGFYGVSNARDDRTPDQPLFGATYVKPLGEWNACELTAIGSHVTAWVNGVKVNEVDLSTKDPDMGYDNHPHSGVRSRKGHFIWWVGNPGVPVQWRNIRVKEIRSAVTVNAGKRRFLYSDFMNRKLVYVDEANEAAYWEAFLPEVAFDLTRGGLNRLVASQRHGARLYDLGQMRFLSEIVDPEHLKYATSATRLSDGRTFILDGGTVHEYCKDGKWTFAYTFGDRVARTRTLRFTDRGTVLISANTGFAEVRLDRTLTPEKRILRWFQLPGTPRYCYQAEYLKDGSCLTTGGYLPEAVRFAADGTVLERHQARQPDGMSNYFYGGFSLRPNGNRVVANWTGHSGRDFIPGWKLIEFAPDGTVVWKWDDSWAGTPASVIVFD